MSTTLVVGDPCDRFQQLLGWKSSGISHASSFNIHLPWQVRRFKIYKPNHASKEALVLSTASTQKRPCAIIQKLCNNAIHWTLRSFFMLKLIPRNYSIATNKSAYTEIKLDMLMLVNKWWGIGEALLLPSRLLWDVPGTGTHDKCLKLLFLLKVLVQMKMNLLMMALVGFGD